MDKFSILDEAFERIRSYILSNADNTKPVVKYRKPADLVKNINLPVAVNGVSEHEFMEFVDKYLEYSVRTGNKQFFNQLYAGFNFPAFIGELITALTNTSMYTYEVAPVATTIEKEMIKLMNRYAGYKDGDGIFVSGGSNANLVAMFSARNRIIPESRLDGYDKNLKLKAFINEQAHYSFETAANILGIGARNVVKIKSDHNGKMIPGDLEDKIAAAVNRGEKPFFAAATCATTLLGAYDPVEDIADICQKYNLWLHADGAFGGSLILSDKYRHLMKGIEKTDSFGWNPHKLMNIPLICSVLLVKKKGVLQHNITDINADYIFHDHDAIEDLGKKSIQCGRRVDAVKLWFAWKYYGLTGYQKRIDNLIEMAKYAEKKVNENDNLELLAPRQSFTVCFRYLPEGNNNLNTFNRELRESLRISGKTIVNFGYTGDTLALRLVTANGELRKSDIDLFFEHVISEGGKLERKQQGNGK